MRVLSWNLKHGRAEPSAGRYLLDEFAQALRSWNWDVALLQEVPPWWPAELAATLGGQARWVLTSRNFGLALRRALAIRWPDVIKSNGGGANAILVRGLEIAEHRTQRLCIWPERRQLHAVRLESGVWIGNLHATVGDDAGARRDAERARSAILQWAAGAPVVLGGDFNVRRLSLGGFRLGGRNPDDVDFVFCRALEPTGAAEVLEKGTLSDHAPVLVELEAAASDALGAAGGPEPEPA